MLKPCSMRLSSRSERGSATPTRFPYGVIYLPVPDQACIVVLAVLYCGRDPNLWRQRSRA